MKNHLLVAAICLFISACNSGGNGNTANIIDPSTIAVGTSTTATVNTQQPSVNLLGIATVTLAPGDLAATPTVTITKGQDAQSAQIFTDSQADLQIQSGTDYEVVFNTTAMPTLDTPVSATVPSALAAKVASGQTLAVYYEIPADDEQPAIYRPLASNYDPATRLISVTLPTYAYQLQSNGTFQAKIKIGVATGYAASAALNSTLAGVLVGSPQSTVVTDPYNDLWCPLDQCVEVSRFQENRNGKPHTGVDLRAALDTPVHAALGGKVERFYGPTGSLVISSVIGSYTFILKYTHLSMDLVFAPNLVSKGELIALSGNKFPTPIDPHLHLDVIVPAVSSCQPNVGTVGNCFFLLDYHDPFPQLIKKAVITEISNPPVTTFNVNQPLVLSLDEVDSNGTAEKPITSDVIVTGNSKARRVLWEVTAPNAAAFPVPADGGDYTAFAMYPNKTTSSTGLGLLNQATFKPKLSGTYTIKARWEDTNLTAFYTVTVSASILHAFIGQATTMTDYWTGGGTSDTGRCGGPGIPSTTTKNGSYLFPAPAFALNKVNGSWVPQSVSYQSPGIIGNIPATEFGTQSLSSSGLITETSTASATTTTPTTLVDINNISTTYISTGVWSMDVTTTLDLESGLYTSKKYLHATTSISPTSSFFSCNTTDSWVQDIYTTTFPISLVPGP